MIQAQAYALEQLGAEVQAEEALQVRTRLIAITGGWEDAKYVSESEDKHLHI